MEKNCIKDLVVNGTATNQNEVGKEIDFTGFSFDVVLWDGTNEDDTVEETLVGNEIKKYFREQDNLGQHLEICTYDGDDYYAYVGDYLDYEYLICKIKLKISQNLVVIANEYIREKIDEYEKDINELILNDFECIFNENNLDGKYIRIQLNDDNKKLVFNKNENFFNYIDGKTMENRVDMFLKYKNCNFIDRIEEFLFLDGEWIDGEFVYDDIILNTTGYANYYFNFRYYYGDEDYIELTDLENLPVKVMVLNTNEVVKSITPLNTEIDVMNNTNFDISSIKYEVKTELNGVTNTYIIDNILPISENLNVETKQKMNAKKLVKNVNGTITDGDGNSFTYNNELYFIAIRNPNDILLTTTLKLAKNIYSILKYGETILFDDTKYPLYDESLIANGIYNGDNPNEDCKGYIELGDDKQNANVVLFDYYDNDASQNNMEVTFPHYVAGHSEKINKCTFGCVYNNRIFLSGNTMYKNVDWHSGALNDNLSDEDDLLYFSDLDYCNYGTSQTAVIGYDIYKDGSLIVFKEKSNTEATLYMRTNQMITAMDYAGNQLQGNYEEGYPCFDINTNGGESAISNKSITNFVGETIFLSKEGIKILMSNNKTYNSVKQTSDVSKYINQKILEEGLEDEELFAYGERLYLRTNRGFYIGEYKLKNDDGNYEWYFIDINDIKKMFEYGGTLYFIDENNLLKMFGKNEYNENEFVDVDTYFLQSNGAEITFPTSEYLDLGFAPSIKEKIENEDIVRVTFRSNIIVDEENYKDVRLFGKVLTENNNIRVRCFQKYDGDNLPIYLEHYSSRVEGIVEIDVEHIIDAYYITKPYDLGTTLYEKNIHQWVLVNDSAYNSVVDVAPIYSNKQQDFDYFIRNAQRNKYNDSNATDVQGDFGFNNFNFTRFSFTNYNMPIVHNRVRNIPRVNFVRFLLKNNNYNNMVFNKLSVNYSIGSYAKGER